MALTTTQETRKAWLEKALAGIDSALLGALSSGAESVSINGRSMSRYNPQDLDGMRKRYNRELENLERIEAGQRVSKSVRVYL